MNRVSGCKILNFTTSNIQSAYKLSEDFCKTIFSQILNRNTRCYCNLKEECLQFHSDLNEHLPGRWVGRATDTDNTCTWPPRSPHLTVCDFFLCGFVKDNVYVPPLPKTLPELRERINTAVGNVTQDRLERVWREWEYRLDICRVTRGAHIERI